jgi:hypothetical protein
LQAGVSEPSVGLAFKWGAIAHNLIKLVRKILAGEARLVPAA